MAKQGILRLTPEFLKNILDLPEGITLEHVYETPVEKLHVEGKAFYLVLEGNLLPYEVQEAQTIPMIRAEVDRPNGRAIWRFKG